MRRWDFPGCPPLLEDQSSVGCDIHCAVTTCEHKHANVTRAEREPGIDNSEGKCAARGRLFWVKWVSASVCVAKGAACLVSTCEHTARWDRTVSVCLCGLVDSSRSTDCGAKVSMTNWYPHLLCVCVKEISWYQGETKQSISQSIQQTVNPSILSSRFKIFPLATCVEQSVADAQQVFAHLRDKLQQEHVPAKRSVECIQMFSTALGSQNGVK